jgi:hypothetical protein
MAEHGVHLVGSRELLGGALGAAGLVAFERLVDLALLVVFVIAAGGHAGAVIGGLVHRLEERVQGVEPEELFAEGGGGIGHIALVLGGVHRRGLAELAQVAQALEGFGGAAGLGEGGEQDGDEDGDDADDDQELDEGEAASAGES